MSECKPLLGIILFIKMITSWIPYSKIPYKIPPEITNKKKEKWIVTEKIHGANFSVFYDGCEVILLKGREYCRQMKLFININDSQIAALSVSNLYGKGSCWMQ